MRILVIGGTRFMGPVVVQRLHNLGHEITIFHRGQRPATLPSDIQHIQGDRDSLTDFTDSFQRLAPDVVLDMIPATEREAQEVMSVFKGIARRIVAISSQDVYRAFGRVNGKESGPADPLPLTEESPLRENLYPHRGLPIPDESYSQRNWREDYDKILVERLVMGDPALPGTVLRLPMVYGPGDYQHRLFPYLKRMDDQRPAIVLDESEAEWRWTHGYVENVAAAITLAVQNERASGRIYNVGEPVTFSMAEWIQQIGQAAGWEGKIVRVPRKHMPEDMLIGINTEQDIVTDTSRIRNELGYSEPVALDEAMRRTVAWERGHPPTKIDPKMFDYAAEDVVLAGLSKGG